MAIEPKVGELRTPTYVAFLADPAGRLRYLALGGQDWASPAYVLFLKSLLAQ
ncbi:MAG: hypothetical protein ACYC2R_08845 [Burkholderiales bacterium]